MTNANTEEYRPCLLPETVEIAFDTVCRSLGMSLMAHRLRRVLALS